MYQIFFVFYSIKSVTCLVIRSRWFLSFSHSFLNSAFLWYLEQNLKACAAILWYSLSTRELVLKWNKIEEDRYLVYLLSTVDSPKFGHFFKKNVNQNYLNWEKLSCKYTSITEKFWIFMSCCISFWYICKNNHFF